MASPIEEARVAVAEAERLAGHHDAGPHTALIVAAAQARVQLAIAEELREVSKRLDKLEQTVQRTGSRRR